MLLTVALPPLAWCMQSDDPAGDSQGPDLVRMEYNAGAQYVDIKLTFAEDLVTAGIGPAVQGSILIDADRANMTGFKSGPGFHQRFGIDYEIDLYLTGFGPGYNYATLKYWTRVPSAVDNSVEIARAAVTLGDPLFYPNGSVFVVGASSTYGTDDRQLFLRVPLPLFGNLGFPICGEGPPVCLDRLFPCPLATPQNLSSAYVSVLAFDPYFLAPGDTLPDSGMADGGSGAGVAEFPSGAEDLVASAADAQDDGYAQPGNGAELTGLKAFRHAGGVLAFELRVKDYSLDDDPIYTLLVDLDGNAATGEPVANGSQTLGIDLIGVYQNWDNPIGEANPLAGTLYLRCEGEWCPVNFTDYLATVWRSTPGYVYITLPAAFVQSAAPGAGQTKVVALTSWPLDLYYNDAVPNEGGLALPPSSGVGPEILIEGNGVAISDGDATPSVADYTSFGSRAVASGAVTRTFVVHNSGTASLNLTGTPKVALTGPAAGDFRVIVQPASPVAAGGSTTFKVRFDPSAAGSRRALLSVANDDSDESPYEFAIRGTGTVPAVPEIAIEGNGIVIADGDTAPSGADHTAFGHCTVASGAVTRTFVIRNTGTASLNLTGAPKVGVTGPAAGDFSVIAQPVSPVAARGSATFKVRFAPSVAGSRQAVLSIANDDSDEAPYDFALRGTGVAATQ